MIEGNDINSVPFESFKEHYNSIMKNDFININRDKIIITEKKNQIDNGIHSPLFMKGNKYLKKENSPDIGKDYYNNNSYY